MAKNNNLLLIASLAFIACTNNKNQQSVQVVETTIPVIDLEKAVQLPGKPMQMSDFIESIEYIRPEYPASLVGTVFGISVNDKFLREIGKKGQGPKEHLGIRSSALLDTVVAINSNFNRKILRYGVQGNYLGSLPVSDEVFKINMSDTNRFVIILHQGKYKISREAFNDIRLLEEERSKFIDRLSCCETDDYLLVSFSFDKKRWLVYYDKHSGETNAWAQHPDEVNKYGILVGGGWENDVDGGCKLPGLNAINADYIAVGVLPDKLKEVFAENKKEGIEEIGRAHV